MLPAPFLHGLEDLFRIVYGDVWTLCHNLQPIVCDYTGDLKDEMLFSIQTGHFQIYPNEFTRQLGPQVAQFGILEYWNFGRLG